MSELLEEARKYIRGELPMSPDLPPIFTAKELLEAKFPPDFFELDRAAGVVHVYWSGHDYEIELDRIQTPLDVLRWVHHFSYKSWPLLTPGQLGRFAKKLALWGGWPIYGKAEADG